MAAVTDTDSDVDEGGINDRLVSNQARAAYTAKQKHSCARLIPNLRSKVPHNV
jgi:hypothetical protein